MLSSIQLKYIEDNFQYTKEDKLIEDMAKLKSFMPEAMFQKVHVLNEDDCFADMWLVTHDYSTEYSYRCICGKALKRRYLLKHKYKEIEVSLGQVHYEHYCNIDINHVNKIVVDQEQYSKVLEEFEKKMMESKEQRLDLITKIEDLPEKYKEQLSLGLPLLDYQIRYLKKHVNIGKVVTKIMRIPDQLYQEITDLKDSEKKACIIQLQSGREIDSIQQIRDIQYHDLKDRSLIEPDNFNPQQIRFFNTIKDSKEKESMMKNTLEGRYKIINARKAKKLSSKLHRQCVNKISFSDRQHQAFTSDLPQTAYDWTNY